ncbi:hypothetical protein evm_007641 [Chilo suppressalis]|nr:hypothetical protein evm_007641 [Chilo suppressalis]
MALRYNYHNCCLLDHNEFIFNVYKDIVLNEKKFTIKFNNKLFCIKNTKNSVNNRKRKHDQNIFTAETINVKNRYEKFKENLLCNTEDKIQKEFDDLTTKEVRELSQNLFEATIFHYAGKSGGNNSETSLRCKIENDYFFIPPKCRFYCNCVKVQCANLYCKYDIIIADPPWWNKYIRRLKTANDKLSYSMMYNEDIASLPVKELLSKNCLIAVWCTNAPSCIEAVKSQIFPAWGLEYVTTWYWLKVTVDLEPICAFGSGCNKQPYERLIIGKVGQINEIPKDRILISVPSALHSHKPPLLDLLTPYVNVKKPEVLELFARAFVTSICVCARSVSL